MRNSLRVSMAVLAVALVAVPASATVFPTLPHAASNFIPFGSGTTVMHQVFDASLFTGALGGQPTARITGIGFSPGVTGTFNLGSVTVNIGYSNVAPGSLALPSAGTNPSGPLVQYFNDPNYSVNVTVSGSNAFSEMVLNGSFDYTPANGNLLLEFVLPNAGNTALHVSRAGGSAESTRAYETSRFGNAVSNTATRMDFTFTGVPEPATATLLGLGLLGLAIRRRR